MAMSRSTNPHHLGRTYLLGGVPGDRVLRQTLRWATLSFAVLGIVSLATVAL